LPSNLVPDGLSSQQIEHNGGGMVLLAIVRDPLHQVPKSARLVPLQLRLPFGQLPVPLGVLLGSASHELCDAGKELFLVRDSERDEQIEPSFALLRVPYHPALVLDPLARVLRDELRHVLSSHHLSSSS